MVRFTLMISILAFASSGFCWGPTGHRVTGQVAEKYLNKKAKKKLNELLQGKSLAFISTWMDEVRADSSFKFMDDWHWVTIPDGITYQESEKNKNGDIIQSIEKIIAELKTKKLSREEQVLRIKILTHLIGDIHQPLHVGARPDRGGNNVKVMWFKNESNLHRVWDSEMIDDSKLSFTELTSSLDTPSADNIAKWTSATPIDWAVESQSYAETVYNIGDGKLGYEYTYLNFPTVRLRLLQAGIRLAHVLNEIYGR
jgi:hypothetical protein